MAGGGARIDILLAGIADWHLVGLDQAGLLEQPLHLLACGDVALVSAILNPDAPLQVVIRFVDTLGHLDQDNQARGGLKVAAGGIDRWPQVQAGGISG